MKHRMMRTGVWLALLAAAGTCWAHKPIVVDGGPTTATTAYSIAEPSISQVAYHERTAEKPELWFTFHLEANTKLFLQAGVPKIERYAALRPAMALLGPGLPAVEVPFAVPQGYGGIVFATDDETPEEFYEQFTGTDSWLFAAHEPVVTEAGQYFLVGYIPGGQDGKFWMTIGRKEQFGFKDIITLPKVLFEVRAFHETSPFGGILFWAMAIILLLIAFFFVWLLL